MGQGSRIGNGASLPWIYYSIAVVASVNNDATTVLYCTVRYGTVLMMMISCSTALRQQCHHQTVAETSVR